MEGLSYKNKGCDMSAKKITEEELDSKGWCSLEDILAFVNGGKYEKFYLSRPKEYSDGSRQFLTRKGAKVYGRLVSILYACARVCGDDDTSAAVNELVEELDSIINEAT